MALVPAVGSGAVELGDGAELAGADELVSDVASLFGATAVGASPELQAAVDNTVATAAHPASRTPVALFLREKPTRTTFRRRPHLLGRRFRPRCVARSITASTQTGAGSRYGCVSAPVFSG